MVVKQAQESLLVLDKQNGKKVKAVSGTDGKDNLMTIPPKKEHESNLKKPPQSLRWLF